MLDNPDALYEAFAAKDPRFDGRFFLGVSSTGIYCRPVCPMKRPKRENCSFFGSAAEAELAGYRPCLVCRPELAPGSPFVGPSAGLARRAARMLEDGCAESLSLEELSWRLGCSSRHLRRAFAEEYRVTPVAYLQTCRLLLAKSLLTDTGLSVLETAMAAGFGSLRRFNGLFRARYRLKPTSLRKRAADGERADAGLSLSLGYRPPYRWDEILGFLGARALAGVEKVAGGEYMRAARIAAPGGKTALGWLKVAQNPRKDALSVTLSESLLPALPQALARVKRLFDTCCDPESVYARLSPMNDVAPGSCPPGLRVPGSFDSFETAVRAVLGQQIAVKAAGTLAARIAAAYGAPVATGEEGLDRAFPSPGDFLAMGDSLEKRLGELGVVSARSGAIGAMAKLFADGDVDMDFCASPERESLKLRSLPGIGSWTAGYIAMRAMGWPDVFLETDAGVKKALPGRTSRELKELAEAWRPWRSYATVGLWNSLGRGQGPLAAGRHGKERQHGTAGRHGEK
ncbi:MAG: helix-turn-helix domain-containing protein [Deltaproteobacteria bacterium]|jgi:AraC family transcriptional regulator of adaptative response / DNA-3-methyladenine glycosylase II|nr:helix-turn-helix domain-containing protein [Deltaproteobacteria bacterium]